MNEKLQAEINHYAQLKKDMPQKLEELRKEFPSVSADAVIKKYRTKQERDNSVAHTAARAKR